jgi:hypothetical protein
MNIIMQGIYSIFQDPNMKGNLNIFINIIGHQFIY